MDHNTTNTPYQKIVRNIVSACEIISGEKIVFLVERHYIRSIPHVFWNSLLVAFDRIIGPYTIIYYNVNTTTRKARYCSKSGRDISVQHIIRQKNVCIDFLSSGQAFYKSNQIFSEHLRNIRIVSLSPETADLFMFTYRQMRKILAFRNQIIQYINDRSYIEHDGLKMYIKGKTSYYCSSGHKPGEFRQGGLLVLPFDQATLFVRSNEPQQVIKTHVQVSGHLHTQAILQDIIHEEQSSKGVIDLIVQNNKVLSFSMNNTPYPLQGALSVVHITFGTNPYIKNHKNMTMIAERKEGWMCLGLEDSHRTHIDVCFPHRLLPWSTKAMINLSTIL